MSRSARQTRVRRPTNSRRSTPAPSVVSSPPHGVQNITRKVIKRLEGLGHLDDSDESDDKEEREERGEVEQSLMMHLNGSATSPSPAPDAISKIKLPRKIDWEIPRKTLHSSIGFLTVYLFVSDYSSRTVVYALCSALCIIVPADILRLNNSSFEVIYERCLGFLMRESEKRQSNGVIWYIVGVIFALASYPVDVAVVAVLILSWADTAASTFGRLWGPYTPSLPKRLPLIPLPLSPRKSLAGFLAASLTGATIALGFWKWIVPLRQDASGLSWRFEDGVLPSPAHSSQSPFGGFSGWSGLALISIAAGLITGVAEALDVNSLDDNLTLPIIAGGSIFAFLRLLGWISGR